MGLRRAQQSCRFVLILGVLLHACATRHATQDAARTDGPHFWEPGDIRTPSQAKIVTTERGGRLVVNEIIIQVKPGTTRAQVDALAATLGGRVVGQLALISVYQLEVPAGSLPELMSLIKKVEKDPIVASAHTHDLIVRYGRPVGASGQGSEASGDRKKR